MIRAVAVLLLALALGGGALAAAPRLAGGQSTDGEIRGRLAQGTAGAPALDSIPVQLIILGGASGLETADTVSGEGGAFRFEVPADPQRTYVVRVEHQGVQYLSPPLLLSRELPTIEIELTLFEATSERPDLRIESTLVTLLALDRTTTQLTIERVDEVTNLGDRIYVGDETGVTLRLPLPEGVVGASGAGTDSGFAIEGGVLAGTTALRPGADHGRHALRRRLRSRRGRLQPAHHRAARDGRMEIEVPARFIQDLKPLDASEHADSREVSGERVEVITRPAARPGESVSVRLEGLSGRNASNPLAGKGGALAGRAAGARGDRRRRAAAAARPRRRNGSGRVIEARGLTRRFGSTLAVDHVSFEVPEGAKVALLGANGAGKTTLLALLSTLLSPSEGEATVAGHDLASNGSALRASIGVLTHRPMLYEELTPQENLRFFARLYSVADADERIEELLRAVGLWLRRDEPTAVLSRGFHQRLAIARALLHRPPVLLLDEPETGLDREALEVLDRLVLHAPGLTVLAATHLRERVASWADGVLELEHGRLLEGDAAAAPGVAARAAR